MDEFILQSIRFALMTGAIIGGMILMVRTDDNHVLRWLACITACAIIFFHEVLADFVYKMLLALFELFLTVMGGGFVILLVIVIALLPVIIVVRWLTH